ncbi:TraM recognition domain-containing protein [Streptomyces sp. AM 4-1-1]|uniref:type IV secretory system conjugative DNA transfer family protein n=1 Tax=Streptomyces sp. AM 4-1-1 TaxID=3028710 RepID=UPI0023B9708F|nr:TraM recognition domain-containing protein [Streptomyces sp. AM 4-1-1]WEH33624.1 TraM recognition domain-containing protein [Streptomyces sp. AM 4-1-1]
MSLITSIITSVGLALLYSAFLMGLKGMAAQTDERVTYRLTFPADLTAAQVTEWIKRISGTLHSGPRRLMGLPSVVFEVRANDREISHWIRVPRHQERFIVPQLRSLVPGMTATPETDEPAHQWMAAVELGHTHPDRTLDIQNAETISTSVLTAMDSLGRGEELLYQWVVAPAVRQAPPALGREQHSNHFSMVGQILSGSQNAGHDEITDRRTKLSEPNFVGVLRIAAKGFNKQHAASLIAPIKATLASIRTAHNGFRKRIGLESGAIKRVAEASSLMVYPAQLSASELGSLVAWPIGAPHLSRLPRSRTRHLPASAVIALKGRIIGESNFPGGERPLALTPVESAQHLQVVGPTGSGKTVLLNNLIAQDMRAGRGVVLIESKGDLFNEALARVPEHRLQDVVLLDVTDTAYPVGFNLLQGNPYAVASEIQRLFDHLYPQDARGVRVRQGFYHLILTLLMSTNAERPMTFADIGALSVPRVDQEEFANNLIAGVSHLEELAGWWQDIQRLSRQQRENYFKPLTDRTWQLTSRRSLRNIIGQSQSTIDMHEVIRGKKILLVNLGRATEGKETAGLLGSLILNYVWSAVQGGAANPRNPTMLYLDEFQDFLNLPIAPADMFAQARSLGLAMTVAHQHIGQLSKELQEATQTNARSTVVFQTSADDAKHFARQFGRNVTDEDFMNQGRFEVIMRLATSAGVSPPATALTLPPVDTTGIAERVRQLSRKSYGRPIADVEREIAQRRGAKVKAKRSIKRRFGGGSWHP